MIKPFSDRVSVELTEAAQFFQVCREWESTAHKVNGDVRLALIRIGVVLGKDGGALGMNNKQANVLPVLILDITAFYGMLDTV